MRGAIQVGAAFAAITASAGIARATCDGCCEQRETLVGWSDDGGSYAVLVSYGDGDGETLALRDGETERVWNTLARHDDDHLVCAGLDEDDDDGATHLPRGGDVDVATWAPLRDARLRPVDAAWRDAFAKRLEVVATGARRFRLPPITGVRAGETCDQSWEVRDRSSHRTLAVLPRGCSDSLVHAKLAGGYVEPTGRFALVKLAVDGEGETHWQAFVRVAL